MREHDVMIDGVAFMSLFHHDGRFARGGGLFAFARRDLDGGRTLLHFELAQDISTAAGPDHRRWGWAISQGMNELLVHLAGSQQRDGEPLQDASPHRSAGRCRPLRATRPTTRTPPAKPRRRITRLAEGL